MSAPPPVIRPIALAIIRRDDRLLVFKGEDPMKPEVFYRPLGGGIEFGEAGEVAVRRELREEIGAELDHVRPIGALENLFTFYGGHGHEIVLLFEADLADMTLYQSDHIAGVEANGAPMDVVWKPLADFRAGEILYPHGLLALLNGARG